MIIGKIDYGTWKIGASIIDWNNICKKARYTKYLNSENFLLSKCSAYNLILANLIPFWFYQMNLFNNIHFRNNTKI